MTTELFTSPSGFPNPQGLRLFMHEKGKRSQRRSAFKAACADRNSSVPKPDFRP
jgi:hypothetical protein